MEGVPPLSSKNLDVPCTKAAHEHFLDAIDVSTLDDISGRVGG